MTRWSIRAQIVIVIGVLLLLAIGTWLSLATSVITDDKERTVYDINALVAGTVATQVENTLESMADKLRYFGQEYETTPGEAERRARSLFLADDEVLSLEVFRRTGNGYERSFLFTDRERLAALNIAIDDLQEARKQTPVPHTVVSQSALVIQNASIAPDLALLRVSVPTGDGRAIVTADLRPERVLRAVTTTSRSYRVYLVDGLGHILAHPDPAKVINHEDVSTNPAVKEALSGKVSRGAQEFQIDKKPVLAAFARVSDRLAAVVVEIPRDEVFSATRQLFRRSLFFAIGVISLALVLAVLVSRRVTAPLRSLEAQMKVVSQGQFGVEVPINGASEVASVGKAFNNMSNELVRRSEELQRTNAQLVQSEKLSAVGELAASVAHEVKNPMVGIVGFAQLGQESNDVKELREYMKLIEQDTLRANKILQTLLEFARPPEMEMEPADLNDVVQGTLALCRHQLQMGGVAVDTQLASALPKIKANNNQLRQVLLNLMINAGQAMEQSPTKRVTVSTALSEKGDVVVRVADTGPGISEEVKRDLFKPFFTTKRRGIGTGLGLSVSKSIIEAHRGTIHVESAPNSGATFVIQIPPMS